MSATSRSVRSVLTPAILLAAQWLAAPTSGQSAEPAGDPPVSYSETLEDTAEKFSLTIRMRVSPAAESTPALKYRFLVPPVDQVHANAATFYYKSMVIDGHDWLARDEQALDWLDMPIEKLPIDEVKKRVAPAQDNEFQAALKAGACADHCDWGDPIRELGVNTIFFEAQKLRNVARTLALLARVQIAEHRYADAVETLRLSYALSRNLGHSPTIVQSLIGMAIDGVSNEAARALIANPDSPNLYWAFTELASRPVELREGLSYETRFWEFTLHKLSELEQRPLTPAEALEIVRRMYESDDLLSGPHVIHGPWGTAHELALVSSALAIEPVARAYLVEHGYTDAQIEAMPIVQRGLLYRWRQFDEARDRFFKWALLPEDEAQERLLRLRAEEASIAGSDAGAPFVEELPAAFQALGATLRKQRDVNLLRTVEALRMYAAQHGDWPQKLADVTVVPVPLDPVTGNPFVYSVAGGVATLDAPAKKHPVSDGQIFPNRQFFATRYELTLRKPASNK